jgi:opacity protein-like surface antigen
MIKYAIAAVLAAGICAPAMAQDEVKNGWYFGLKTGLADSNNPTFTVTDTSTDDQLVTKLETKSAWAIAGETGYDFGDFRFGVEVKYQRNKVKGINFVSLNDTALTEDDMDELLTLLEDEEIAEFDEDVEVDGTTVRAANGSIAKLRQLGVMANLTYDIPTGSAISPYIGGGLGAVGTHVKAFGDDGSIRFAWQLMAGASVNVSPNFDITADYSYRQTSAGNLKFGDDEDLVYRLGKTKTSFFTVGARLTF